MNCNAKSRLSQCERRLFTIILSIKALHKQHVLRTDRRQGGVKASMKNCQGYEQQTDIFTIFAKATVTDGQSDNDIKARNMDKYEFKKTMTKWEVFGLMMRYLSVSAVTVALVLCTGLSGSPETEWIIIAMIVVPAVFFLPITLLFLCYYIYSLFKSTRPKSRHDRILLWLHAVDVVLIVTAVFLSYNTKQHCDAFVMEDCYLENRSEMRRIIKEVKTWVPDSVTAGIVFKKDGSLDIFASSYNTINFNDYGPQHGRQADGELTKPGLSGKQLNLLFKWLKGVGCHGILLNASTVPPSTTLYFRRDTTGLFSFMLYNRPLTEKEKADIDALNMIPFGDVAFRYEPSNKSDKTFPKKAEFMKARGRKVKNLGSSAVQVYVLK